MNQQIHRIVRQSGMVNEMEVEDYFIRKLQSMAISQQNSLPILNNALKGYVPDGRQLGIACNKFPGGIDQFLD